MKKLGFVGALVVGLFVTTWFVWAQNKTTEIPTKNFEKATSYTVVRIIDGDTFVLQIGDKDITIRLIGVDTPESVHPQKPTEHYSKEASEFTTNLLKGEIVYIEYDSANLMNSHLDRYGRTLAYVYRAPDGLFVNLEIVRQGYGRADIHYPFEYMELFRFYEQKAHEIGKGLWLEEKKLSLEEIFGVEPEEEKKLSPEEENEIFKEIFGEKLGITKTETKETISTEPKREIIVYITKTGKKYHRSGCRYLSRSMIPISLSDAKSRGYTPCSVCKPPR